MTDGEPEDNAENPGQTEAPAGEAEPPGDETSGGESRPAASNQTTASNQSPDASAQTPEQDPAAEPAETAPAQPPVPPEDTAPGLWETEDGLYYVQEDGTCLTEGSVGYLLFGADGRYTSGSADLDAGIDDLIASVCPDLSVDREARLRLLYNYIRDHYRYLSMPHYEAGSTYWANDAALTMITQGKGNCYNFTALFTACARRLGYQAYNIAGHEYSTTNDHAWTMIYWPDGSTYLFDVQLEYAYLYIYSNKPVIDMFKVSGGNGSYNGFAYYFP